MALLVCIFPFQRRCIIAEGKTAPEAEATLLERGRERLFLSYGVKMISNDEMLNLADSPRPA